MKYSIAFSLLSLVFVIYAIFLGDFWFLLLWPATSFALLGAAYAGLGAKLLGKRSNGKIAWWAWILFLPYLLLTLTLWHLRRLFGGGECCNEIGPGIWLGRRPLRNELPDSIAVVVDLTAEMPEPRQIVVGKTYICVPVLDASVPDDHLFRTLIEKVRDCEGNVYIHCALGHGRSATVVAALLFARKLVINLNEAVSCIKAKRPRVRLNRAQRQLLVRWSQTELAKVPAPGGSVGV